MVKACHFLDGVVMGSIERAALYGWSVEDDTTVDIVLCNYKIVDLSFCRGLVGSVAGNQLVMSSGCN